MSGDRDIYRRPEGCPYDVGDRVVILCDQWAGMHATVVHFPYWDDPEPRVSVKFDDPGEEGYFAFELRNMEPISAVDRLSELSEGDSTESV